MRKCHLDILASELILKHLINISWTFMDSHSVSVWNTDAAQTEDAKIGSHLEHQTHESVSGDSLDASWP